MNIIKPHFESLNELIEFFDNTDLSDYFENMPEVDFDVKLQKKIYYFSLDFDMANRIIEIANSKHTSPKSLILAWLKEKIEQK